MIKMHGRYYWLDIWIDGKRVRRSLKTDEHGLALEKARDIAAQLKAGAGRKGVDLKAFSNQYLEWARAQKPSSVASEEYRLKITVGFSW